MGSEMGSAPAPTRREVLSLFRSLLRTSRELTDYNVREYAKRRTIDSLRPKGTISDPAEATASCADGKSQLAVAKRQAVVYLLYALAADVNRVMEI